jgi:hypothetical protein
MSPLLKYLIDPKGFWEEYKEQPVAWQLGFLEALFRTLINYVGKDKLIRLVLANDEI